MRADASDAVSRRRFLAAAVAGLPSAACAQAAATADVPPRQHPQDVGRKFHPDGSPMPFVGNSFVGHFGQQGPDFESFDALLDVYREFPRHAFSSKLTLVPPSSWHVTLIGGINDVDRKTPAWPSDLPRDMPFEEVHRILSARLERRSAAPLPPCSFVFDTERKPRARVEGSLGLRLRPADAATEARLQAVRNELADLMRLRRPDHDNYGFHVTIGYLYRFLDARESAAMQAAAVDWSARLAQRGPVQIRSFHFCLLRDMFAYRELRAV